MTRVDREYSGSWARHPRVRLIEDEGRHHDAARGIERLLAAIPVYLVAGWALPPPPTPAPSSSVPA